MKHKLAIDFGTTNSAIATYVEETRSGKTLELPGLSHTTSSGDFLIPTLLYVRDGQTRDVLVGQAIRTQGLDYAHSSRLFANFKRVVNTESPFDAGHHDARIIDGIPWTNKDAGQTFLKTLLAALPFSPDDIAQLVITVPVAAFESYTAWLSRSIEGFPADRIRIVDESTAAALGYAVTEPGAIILVIDFGGGTLDLSLVRLPDSRQQTGKVLFTSETQPAHAHKATVIAKAGVNLGGSDIDQWLLAEVLRQTGLSLETIGPAYPALLTACERAKITLSTAETTEITFQAEDGTGNHRTHTLPLPRAALETLMADHGFFTALRQALEKVMGLAHQKGVYREDIHYVLLVGGTALIPSVQQTLDVYFRAITQRHKKIFDMPEWPSLTWSVDNTTIRVDKPFTAIVQGALQVSAGFGLDDRLSHGYALRVWENNAYRYDELIAPDTPYPTQPVTIHLAPLHPRQTHLELLLGQINADSVTPLNVADPLTLPLQPGQDRLQATFRVDAARQLRLTVTDLKTNQILFPDTPLVNPHPAPTLNSSSPIPAGVDESRTEYAPIIVTQKSSPRFLKQLLGKIVGFLPQNTRSANTLATGLLSEDALVRFDAAKTLTERGDRESRLLLEEILTHGTAPQRASVVWHLGRTSWFTAEPLLRRALDDEDPRVREAAIFALCKMRLPESYTLVKQILQTGSDPMRMSAVWGLSTHPDASAVPVLELALHAANPDIRVQALEVLGATVAPEAIPAVRAALNDSNLDVKYAAALSWVELAGETCFEELGQRILATSGWERRALLRGFFHATNYLALDVAQSPSVEGLIDALTTALTDPLPETRANASMPLAWMRHPRAEQALLHAFRREPDSDVRAHLLSNVVHLMSPIGAQLMAEALTGEDVLVRQTAQYLKQNFPFADQRGEHRL